MRVRVISVVQRPLTNPVSPQGDPNVPAGQVSIEADLSRPMVLSDLQQASVQTLKDIDTPDIPADVALHQLPSQPFRVPADCLDRDTSPKTRAIAR